VDWAKKGYVTVIKDQGACGGCYAFASQASVESALLIANKGTVDLS